MTANELSEALDYIGEHYYAGWGNVMFKDAAIFVKKQAEQIKLLQNDIVKQQVFVCQQQAEIEALKMRELTDEEIKSEAKLFCYTWFSERPERLILFARAILKKASEK